MLTHRLQVSWQALDEVLANGRITSYRVYYTILSTVRSERADRIVCEECGMLCCSSLRLTVTGCWARQQGTALTPCHGANTHTQGLGRVQAFPVVNQQAGYSTAIEGLTAFTEYMVAVAAVTQVGEGPRGNSTTARTAQVRKETLRLVLLLHFGF